MSKDTKLHQEQEPITLDLVQNRQNEASLSVVPFSSEGEDRDSLEQKILEWNHRSDTSDDNRGNRVESIILDGVQSFFPQDVSAMRQGLEPIFLWQFRGESSGNL